MSKPRSRSNDSGSGFKVSLGALLKQKLAEVPPDLAVKLAEAPEDPKKDEKDAEGPKLVVHAAKKLRGRRTRIRTRLE